MRENLLSRNVNMPLIEVKGLKTYFYTEDGIVSAVDDLHFSIDEGETLGVVGESGCGKSATALSVMRLVPTPPGRIAGGEVLFEGEDLLKKSEGEMRKVRGNRISMIFQEPMSSLNPIFPIGSQIMEIILLHQKVSRRAAREKTIEMLRMVGIASPERRVDDYPYQMSGGMRQRVMIAMALSCNPKLLIADEPTTALDVTIQAQILDLIRKLRAELGMAMLLITHDFGVVGEIADKIVVMYAGKIVESAHTLSVLRNPQHPYTIGLLGSIPKLDEDREKLQVIEGTVPHPYNTPRGCRFHPRCFSAEEICRREEPTLQEVEPGHWTSCWRVGR
jgi:oligopeptide/dipeptide ABC transporter ATP-binding protein